MARGGTDAHGLAVVPATDVVWRALASVFGTRGAASRCFCQRYKLARGEAFGKFPAEERANRLRAQTGCGVPSAGATSGLVAVAGGEPVGWCAVEPRPHFVGLVRVSRTPWDSRDQDPADESVWAVTCVLTRSGHRRQGVGRALVAAAVEHARERGARALEAYPITTTAALAEELHPGILEVFLDAGFTEVSRPSPRRAVVRIDF